jgi:hypothetical protein
VLVFSSQKGASPREQLSLSHGYRFRSQLVGLSFLTSVVLCCLRRRRDKSGAMILAGQKLPLLNAHPPRWTRVHTSAISYFLTLPMLGSGVGGFAGVFDFGRWLSESLVWPLEVVLSSGSFLRAASPVKAALNEPHSFDSVDPIFV